MGTLRDIFVHSGAYGARVADETPTGSAAGPLRAADDQTVGWALAFWPQADPDDFEWGLGHMKVRHKESGEIFRIRIGHPVGGELASDVQTFCIRDRRLVLLARPGTERPTTNMVGSYMLKPKSSRTARHGQRMARRSGDDQRRPGHRHVPQRRRHAPARHPGSSTDAAPLRTQPSPARA
jgi:hypothetical protein